MSFAQPAIALEVPRAARYLTFDLRPGADPRPALERLAARAVGEDLVVGLGPPLLAALAADLPGLRPITPHIGPGVAVPSTPAALWAWVRAEDAGAALHVGREVEALLTDAFAVRSVELAFRYDTGRDLTGYEDGTENPAGAEADAAALVAGAGPGRDGASYVAVQRWVHDLGAMDALESAARDHVIGRRRQDNEELADAPAAAHVKRAAQEDFTPPAFVLRRSMPYADPGGQGLVFVAFGRSLDAFDAILARMTGQDDGIVDNLFRFSRPVTGATYWCPPVRGGRLDLSAVFAE
jgi:putative iron-dependent peroxidase